MKVMLCLVWHDWLHFG